MPINFKLLLLAVAGVLASSALVCHFSSAKRAAEFDRETLLNFRDWAAVQGRKYSSPSEFAHRFAIFKKNLIQIVAHNSGTSSYKLALNQFSDLSAEEFSAMYLNLKTSTEPKNVDLTLLDGTPSNDVDWTAKGAVTPVKDQGHCGSCWAFSSTGALEGLDFVKNQPAQVQSFSEQQLVDCSTSYGNEGCNGGLMQDAFKYVVVNGITTEANYPYIAQDQKCKSKAGVFKIKAYKNVPHKSSAALATACDTQPISVSIDATNIIHYSSGVFDNKNCGTQLNHGVLLAGYDAAVWKVKNSWSTKWGENGYIRFSRTANSDAQGGICGILLDASYPTL
jgi:KDEL-tailed cysteine endopeptidase